MSYRIAGIDVHKKMLAVVVSDVEVEDEYRFERRMFGSNPEQLRSLTVWLVEQEVEEVVMESTAQYWKPVWEALERVLETNTPESRRRKPEVGIVASGAGAVKSRATGTQEGFPRRRTSGEAVSGSGIDSELCARCRAASVADGDAEKVPIDARSRATAEPIGISSGRGPH
jgi:hypothetical protein